VEFAVELFSAEFDDSTYFETPAGLRVWREAPSCIWTQMGMGRNLATVAALAIAIAGIVPGTPLGKLASAQQSVIAERFVVVTGHRDATKAALEVLARGGNVMDAAVTASMCVGVAEPYGSGLGGKLLLLHRDGKTGEISAVEAMCAASGSLDAAKFAKLRARERNLGFTSVAVPGLVAGLYEAHEKWGSRPWKELVLPAAELAERGVTIDEKSQRFYRAKASQLKHNPETARHYLVDNDTPAVGAVMKNADLGRSLRLVAEGGPAAFYEGEITRQIVAAVQAAGAPLEMGDFRAYRPQWTKPLAVNFNSYQVYSAPPPLTGGTTVLASLRALEHLDPVDASSGRSADYVDRVGRVLLALYPRVNATIADAANSQDDARMLLGAKLSRAVAAEARAVDPTNPYGEKVPAGMGEATADDRPDASTTHLTIADRDGNIVCMTQSLSYHFGACVIAPGTGFLLNDSMGNFSTRDPDGVNHVGPGKRERSTIAPIIAVRDGKAALTLGIPGGQRIPTTTLQLVVDILGYDVPLAEAFDRPRFHVRRPIGSDESPNIVDLEDDAPAELDQELKDLGWKTTRKKRNGSYFGGGNAVIYQADGKLLGVADLRRTNFAAGQ
jgi:gamma-glutamyltranspeptidase/glutathione hydrolase